MNTEELSEQFDEYLFYKELVDEFKWKFSYEATKDLDRSLWLFSQDEAFVDYAFRYVMEACLQQAQRSTSGLSLSFKLEARRRVALSYVPEFTEEFFREHMKETNHD